MSASLLCRLAVASRSHHCLLLHHHQPASSYHQQRRPKQPKGSRLNVAPSRCDPPLESGDQVRATDEPPVLFIQKYERLVDVRHVLHGAPIRTSLKPDTSDALERDTALSEETLTQRKIKFVLKMVSQSKTFEKLVEKLRENPEPLFSPPLNASAGLKESIFVDDETIRNASIHSLKLELNGADLLKWSDTRLQLRKLPTYYLMLSKARLTMLVCSTAAAGYALAPGTFDPNILVLSTLGTCLIICSANAVNQYLEVPFDSQMNRTKNRVLVRGHLSTLHAMTFAALTAVSGTFLLAHYVNGVAAALGVTNLILYTCIYTPMKRFSILNTWVGSVVGSIPPLIGWTSATGSLDAGALILGGILYAWQFPHFNSLSWNLRQDYSKAGYRMMSVTNPDLCRRVALRYSVGCIAVCSAAPVLDVTNVAFALDSLPLNLYMTYLAWRFYQNADSSSSRKLFRFTLIHLPLLMTLMFISKKRKGEDIAVIAHSHKTEAADIQT